MHCLLLYADIPLIPQKNTEIKENKKIEIELSYITRIIPPKKNQKKPRVKQKIKPKKKFKIKKIEPKLDSSVKSKPINEIKQEPIIEPALTSDIAPVLKPIKKIKPKIIKAIPKYKENAPPKYPVFAKKRGYQGTVFLKVFVNKNGMPETITIFKSSGYLILDNAAIKQVKKWIFFPGMVNNKNIGMNVIFPIKFELKNN